jgi:tetratricopeptide (TPR) repeat protein
MLVRLLLLGFGWGDRTLHSHASRAGARRSCRVRRAALAVVALTAIGSTYTATAHAQVAAPPAEPSAVALDLDGVKTSISRNRLSQFLIATADKHRKARAWAHAIPYYQALVAARGPASPDAETLAKLWTLAGQSEEAGAVWRSIAAATEDAQQRTRAQAEVTRLSEHPDPFADKLRLMPGVIEAKKSFALGRSTFAAKKYGDALVYFHMGYALAPDLPGFLREIGATYDKLGAADKKRDFYQRYLLQRPFGANADLVRKDLRKSNAELGTLAVSSSLPCTELWINRQRLTGPVPQGGVAVAPGAYKGLCFVPKYEMALIEYATVAPGASAELSFRWAVIVNKLDKPLGRIAIENPKVPGVMMDLGVSSPEIGVALPLDDRKLRVQLRDDAGTRSEDRYIHLEPGQRQVIQW